MTSDTYLSFSELFGHSVRGLHGQFKLGAGGARRQYSRLCSGTFSACAKCWRTAGGLARRAGGGVMSRDVDRTYPRLSRSGAAYRWPAAAGDWDAVSLLWVACHGVTTDARLAVSGGLQRMGGGYFELVRMRGVALISES